MTSNVTTEFRDAVEAARESERRFATLISNLPGVAYRVRNDESSTLEFVSDGCFSIVGYSPSELMAEGGAPTIELVHPDDRQLIREKTRIGLLQQKTIEIVYRLRHRSGEYRWIWDRNRGVYSDDGEVLGIEGFLTDITEQRKEREKFIQSERLSAIGQMLSAIAHESRNALQRIQAGVDMLSFELPQESDARTDLAKIGRATKDLYRLLEAIRCYSAPIHLDTKECQLDNVWRQAWSNLDATRRGRDARLEENIGDTNLTCRLDEFRIEQVFRNLMENSLAACSDPIRITIRCEETQLDGVPAVVLGFQDNGPGLTAEQRQRIFEPFFTTKRAGSGLGMAITKRIIDAHQGIIRIEDSAQGAQFELIFPRHVRRATESTPLL